MKALFLSLNRKKLKRSAQKKNILRKKYAMSEAGFEPTDTPKLKPRGRCFRPLSHELRYLKGLNIWD